MKGRARVFHSASAAEHEQIVEDHDDICVEDQCAEDVVIDLKRVTALAKNQLGVVDEEDAEDEDSERAHEHHEHIAVEENREESQHHERHHENEDETSLPREVSLGCPCVGSGGCDNGQSHGACHANRAIAVIIERIVKRVIYVVLADEGDPVCL